MFRRLQASSVATVASVSGASQYLSQQPTQMRQYQDNNGQFTEAAFIDRMDLQQIYPTAKPKVNAGDFGYVRGSYWSVNMHFTKPMRNPLLRRVTQPKKCEIVTIFGASGFIGCHLVKEFLANPAIKKVRACTRYPTHIPAGSELDKIIMEAGDKLELHEADVTNRLQVNVACNGADTIVHAIDYFVEHTNNAHEDVFIKGATHIGMTVQNVKAERVIYVSGLDSTYHSESSWADYRSRGEDAMGGNAPDATIMRFGPLYGEDYRYRGLGKWVYPCLHHQSACKPVWVKDAARAVVLASRSDRAVRMKYDLGGPQVMTHLEFSKNLSALYHRRWCFAMNIPVGQVIAAMCGWFLPNVICPAWHRSWELDAVGRSKTQFENLCGWENLEFEPKTMADAAAIDHTGTDSRGNPRSTIEQDMEILEGCEEREAEAFTDKEAEARKNGIWRAVADPSMGERNGASELLANEPYPGKEWRMEALHGATYPENAPTPGDGGAIF